MPRRFTPLSPPFAKARTSRPWNLLLLHTLFLGMLAPESTLAAGPANDRPPVLFHYQFQGPDPLADRSGQGHTLGLRGETRQVDHPAFGPTLELFPGHPLAEDRPQGAQAPHAPSLTPEGPFTLEVHFRPKPELLADYPVTFLVDKQYLYHHPDHPNSHRDYMLRLQRRGEKHVVIASLGFGEATETFVSQPVHLTTERWHHLAFVYDGAGRGTIHLDGTRIGERLAEGRGSITAGTYPLTLGDRVGSTYRGFPGYLREVRLTNAALIIDQGAFTLQTGRSIFRRLESDAAITLTLHNDTPRPLQGASLSLIDPVTGQPHIHRLPDAAPGERLTLRHPVDTRLQEGDYPLTATLHAADQTPLGTWQWPLSIRPRPIPERMPVVMWGSRGSTRTAADLGFTHRLLRLDMPTYQRVWNQEQPADPPADVIENQALLSEMFAEDLDALLYVYPGRWQGEPLQQRRRMDRQGQIHPRGNLCGLDPAIEQFCFNVGKAVMRDYGAWPNVAGALVHSEVRDRTQVCFHESCQAAFRAYAGFDIPAAVQEKNGVRYAELEAFPLQRVLPADDPILTFYRWFWTAGDAWNTLHTQVDRGLKSQATRPFWTFFDPALRAPSIAGSGGEVDVLSQWTYTYPNPVKIEYATDALFAMPQNQARQQVMKMTQLIWYRRLTAPQQADPPRPQAAWETAVPDAQFITIPPDHLREALWFKLARPIQGVMYHGWESLVQETYNTSYKHTHPQTQATLQQLVREVLEPLGPMLRKVPDIQSDVAFLESFTSQMFAGRGGYGWANNWSATAYQILRYAQLQPHVIYEHTLLESGLDAYQVLVLTECDVLTEPVVQAIAAFQNRGGILIADEHLTPALEPDILLPALSLPAAADQGKALLLEKAAELRRELDPHYRRRTDSSNPEVLTRLRRYGSTDYLFAINDHRQFGDYVGHHGLVMEDGLPSSTTLRLRREGGVVYTLPGGGPAMEARVEDGDMSLPVTLNAAEGRLFMITARPIQAVHIDVPPRARAGENVPYRIQIFDDRAQPLDAVLPLHVVITDPSGRIAESSGFYGAQDGQSTLSLDLPINATPGPWQIQATERASGRTDVQTIEVSVP